MLSQSESYNMLSQFESYNVLVLLICKLDYWISAQIWRFQIMQMMEIIFKSQKSCCL